jgi:KipI family sensor histidine kinase inhibitor
LAFRAAVEAEGLPGVTETAPTLTSVVVRFDPERADPGSLAARLADLAASRDWRAAPLPAGRRRWRLPAAFGGTDGPDLDAVAAAAGADPAAALAARPLRVLTIGFAPGQPYLGLLPPAFDLPRRSVLTPRVPPGAIAVAVRQAVLFTIASPTGWHWIGRTAFRGFRPGAAEPFPLRPGDEIAFEPVSAAELAQIAARDPEGGGARAEVIG